MNSNHTMMMKKSLMLMALALVAAPSMANAQFAVEVRGGGAVGNHAPAAAGLETVPGASWSAAAMVQPLPWTSLYVEYARSGFGCEEGFCTGQTVTVTSSGFGGGVRLHPVRWAWVQGGLLSLTTELSSDAGSETGAAELSYELGAGLSVPLIGPARLVPGVMYRAGLEAEGRTAVVAGEVGVRIEMP